MAVTIQDDMLRVANMLPGDQPREFICAMALYGMFGDEPDPEEPWLLLFEAFRGRLDMSIKKHANGSKGGRPAKVENQSEKPKRKTTRQKPRQENQTVETTGSKPKEKTEMRGEERSRGEVSGDEVRRDEMSGVEISSESTDIDYYSFPEESYTPPPTPSQTPAARAFEPPTPDEVSLEIQMQGYSGIDAEEFCSHYESQGWLKGNGLPMTNWKASLRDWHMRRRRDADERTGKEDELHRMFARYDEGEEVWPGASNQ